MLLETTAPLSAPRTPRRGPAARLREALLALAGQHGEITRHTEKAWASVTFTGVRHTIALAFTGPGAVESGERLIARLPEHEFAIPGQLAAHAAVTSAKHTILPEPALAVECEILLLEDA